MRRLASVVVSGLLAAVAVLSAADVLTPQLAEAFEKKMVIVQAHAASEEATSPRTTRFTENELNSYLRYKVTDQLPTGLSEPTVTLTGKGRVTARAFVDLDVIRQKQSSGGWFDLKSYLSGKLAVAATGIIRTEAGKGRFEFELAEVSGVPVPKALLQQIVAHYTKSAEQPNGASLDDTFDLPVRIQRIDVEPGRAIVIQ